MELHDLAAAEKTVNAAGILERLEGHLVQKQAVGYRDRLQSLEQQTTNSENAPELKPQSVADLNVCTTNQLAVKPVLSTTNAFPLMKNLTELMKHVHYKVRFY